MDKVRDGGRRPEVPVVQQLASVVHNPSRERFELWVAGDLAGVLGYSTEVVEGQRVVTFLHTVLYDEYTGQGLARRLTRGALQYVIDTRSKVRPVCSFTRHYLTKNPNLAFITV
ncbi:GNAT family N-acetyltransferase [Williamsia sterculiae]|uniref:N-acetyltransferase domain-containing protein n=1 Tax=Williamsia sterculiae TaxID=1344003 RepID=A0A1N7F108_9NOCA|nr:GNAT family N-acetyltransferase [Williamsia sterculiae]SIR94001.1 hypothetical protein SAMN05445060_1707 [Williamsia sterculiae]